MYNFTSINFVRDIFELRELLFKLTIHDFKKSYLGSMLGTIWVFLNPLLMTLIFMLIFGLGFKSRAPVGEVPFIVWFLCGLFSWNFFKDTISNNTTIFQQYKFLITKINFRNSIIPVIKYLSNTFLHLVNMLLLTLVLLAYSFPITIYWLQILYYFIAMSVLVLGLSWTSSVLTVFIPDIKNIVQVAMRLGFFATPIFWTLDRISPDYQWIFQLNPMAYILQGYRDSMIFQVPFWHDINATIYFWIIALSNLLFGIFIYTKFRKEMTDML